MSIDIYSKIEYNIYKVISLEEIKMAKILSVSSSVVCIGADDGSIREVRASDLNFIPKVGDNVEIFETDTKVIVSKVEEPTNAIPNGGININLQNTQTNQGAGMGMPTYVTAGKVVSKVVYCVLAFFLGGIGIHKFYAGRTGAGIAMLLFCWTGIPSLIALIDFIVGLTKKSDANGNIII